jgi:hypothetical protein
METDKKPSKVNSDIKELIKPVNIQSEEQFFEVQALCTSFGEGIECKASNKSIDDEDDLLF